MIAAATDSTASTAAFVASNVAPEEADKAAPEATELQSLEAHAEAAVPAGIVPASVLHAASGAVE